MDAFYQELKKFGRVRANFLLSKCSTFQIGGPAKFLVEVKECESLVGLLNFLRENGEDWLILGAGSNILFPDVGLEKIVIKINLNKLEIKGAEIIAEAGVLLSEVVNLSLQNSLSGLEWAAGVPGTVGGAVRGNAGAMGSDASKNISQVEVWHEGETLVLGKKDCGFIYRGSLFKTNQDLILRAWFSLSPGDKQQSLSLVQDYLDKRKNKLPTLPSAGSFFQNVCLTAWPGKVEELPSSYRERGMIPAGYLIEEAGLLGLQIGGAEISAQHGNFIVNQGGATQEDVLALVEKAKEEVYNKSGVELQPEVEIIK